MKNFNAYKDPTYIPDITVDVKKYPSEKIAYIKRIGKLNDTIYSDFKKLQSWAESRDLWSNDSRFILIIYDSPYVTQKDKIRCDICITVPDGIHSGWEVSNMDLPGGRMAVTGVFCVPGFSVISRIYDELANWALTSSYQISGYEYIYFQKGIVPRNDIPAEFNIFSPVLPR